MPTSATGKSSRPAASPEHRRRAAAQAGLSRSSGALAAQAGFTLAELAIVVFIISLFAVFTIPRLPDLTGHKLEKNARRIAHTITYLYSQAAAHRMLLRFNLELKEGKYYASAMNREGAFEPTDFPLFKTGRLSGGVRVLKFTSLFNGTFGGELAYMHLMPEGFAEQAVIVLTDRSGRKLSLVVDPLSGRVTAQKGEAQIKYAGEPA
jgi:general secretion pathway protein H